MGEFFRKLFDSSDFPARWHCGNWSDALGWLHILSDLVIWLAYMGIPIGLGIILRRRRDVPFPRVFWLFIGFIACCGITHLIEAGIFYWPVYRLSGLAKLVTAVVSMATMVAMVSYVDRAVRLPSFRSALSELQQQQSQTSRRIQDLESERSRLQEALIASGIGRWDWRIDSDQVTWDERTCTLFGMPDGEQPAGAAAAFERVHEEDRERLRAEIDAALPRADELVLRFRVGRPDGGVRHLLSRCSLLREGGGPATRMTGVVLDVTAQRESEALFRDAVESAPCGMMVVDEQGIIRLANGNAGALLGWPAQELVGKEVDDFVPDDVRGHHEQLRRSFFDLFERRELRPQRDLVAVRRDGSMVPVEILLSPVAFEGGRGVILTVVDISSRKQAEQQLQRYAEELEGRNRALDEFTYMVSHDLKAPLRAISIVSEWLQDDLGDSVGETSREHLQTLRQRTRAMHVMIDGALNYARENREEGELSEVDCGDVLRDVLQMLEVPGGVVHVTTPLPKLTYDRGHMVKVLLNLVGNALQHGACDAPRVEVSAARIEAGYEFRVGDNGPGIDPVYHEQVFRMFKRVPGIATESSGVGLPIVRLLVERHGGTCRIESALGEGCRVCFTVPDGSGGGA